MNIQRRGYKRPTKKKRCKHAVTYRSGLEKVNQDDLTARGVPYGYEEKKIPYIIPAKTHNYTPDFFLRNGIIIETKGRFLSKDRQKHLWVKDQNPNLEIRFVFSNIKSPIYKGSKTTNATWCEKYGFKYAEKLIPVEWTNEQPNQVWLDAVKALKK